LRPNSDWFLSKEIEQVSSLKKVELEHSQHLMDGPSDFRFEFDIGKQQVDTQGDPELGHDRIPGGAKEGF
jgi:hypothetical protein